MARIPRGKGLRGCVKQNHPRPLAKAHKWSAAECSFRRSPDAICFIRIIGVYVDGNNASTCDADSSSWPLAPM